VRKIEKVRCKKTEEKRKKTTMIGTGSIKESERESRQEATIHGSTFFQRLSWMMCLSLLFCFKMVVMAVFCFNSLLFLLPYKLQPMNIPLPFSPSQKPEQTEDIALRYGIHSIKHE
jgi:hypothetical protein